ncbi:FK506-binding protein [Tricharina praecox]|uniref:FK506-binding protein n=1 Tax=Tricharina praecox TaxID=43433 RepID=UPI00221E7CD3|nr:FK506-binding protein [Tricharina praecox]KAI5846752.1 FK506-binding protein [Tricharina praecox]
MSAGVQSVAFWGLQVPAGDEPTIAASEIPGVHMFRLTMAAIDPSAKPLDETKPKRATLKIIRRPLDLDDYEDEDEEDEEDDEEDDEEEQAQLQHTSKKLREADKAIKKALKAAEQNAMEVDAKEDDSDDDEDSEGGFETEEFVICTLDTERTYQQPLDIIIGEDEEVFFKVDGNYDISLSGNYIIPLNENDDEESYSDEEESEGEEDYDLSPDEEELMNLIGGGAESEDELDDVEEPRITEVESEEDKTPKKKATEKVAEKKLGKAEKKGNKRAAEEDEAKPEEPKLSKKQLKKLKANDGKAVAATNDTPESKKKVQFAKPIEQGPTNGKKDAKQTPEKPATKQTPEKKVAEKKPEAAAPTTRVVQGITVEDKTVGTGAVCKKGNKLGMRYIGKLNDKNGKVFDKNTQGKPFTFRLGKGEVIKGWDIGLVGMRVGGERRITIPASMGYGNKAIPGIPANSTLCFDVKLLEVK